MRLIFVPALVGCSEYNLFGKADDEVAPAGGTTAPPSVGESELASCAGYVPPDAYSVPVDETCRSEAGPLPEFKPAVEWSSLDLDVTSPESVAVATMPAVGNLTDDNGDGWIDESDAPDVAFVTATPVGESSENSGCLRVVDGTGSAVHFSVCSFDYGGTTFDIHHGSSVAIGDLHGDGEPEILVMAAQGLCSPGYLMAFSAAGGVLWVHTEVTFTNPGHFPALADFDGDGDSEIAVADALFDHGGRLLWEGGAGRGAGNTFSGTSSVPVDVDGDGVLELLAGNTVYAIDGSVLFELGADDGWPALIEIDGDPNPEFVLGTGLGDKVIAFDDDGAELWELVIPDGAPGVPTVADLDADGDPEIFVAGKTGSWAIDAHGGMMWEAPTRSQSPVAASAFDFDLDGSAEILLASHRQFDVLDGGDGTVMLSHAGHTSNWGLGYPVVADIDGDESAEIVLASYNYYLQDEDALQGLTVFGDVSDRWPETRRVWNQYAYAVTNIDDDLAVPTNPDASWSIYNSFREAPVAIPADDLMAGLAIGPHDTCVAECIGDVVVLSVSIYNNGLIPSGPFEVLVPSLEVVETVASLDAGEGRYLRGVSVSRQQWGDGLEIELVADAMDQCASPASAVVLRDWPCAE